MTGYGKAEIQLSDGKITVEIRSLNSKNTDISVKTSIIPRDKEMSVRQLISKELYRGNIDLFITMEASEQASDRVINKDVFNSYYNQAIEIANFNKFDLATAILKLPDVIESKKRELDDENWDKLYDAIQGAILDINKFRDKEGEILYNDVKSRVLVIESLLSEVEKFESTRVEAIKERIKSRLEDLSVNPDENRLEQEIIFYVEKLDISEEKVRLKQHCKYFIETINSEPNSGKKLGFIAQEMGREINTLGSKSNQADMQKIVVKMKDELEKIKEQSLNIL